MYSSTAACTIWKVKHKAHSQDANNKHKAKLSALLASGSSECYFKLGNALNDLWNFLVVAACNHTPGLILHALHESLVTDSGVDLERAVNGNLNEL